MADDDDEELREAVEELQAAVDGLSEQVGGEGSGGTATDTDDEDVEEVVEKLREEGKSALERAAEEQDKLSPGPTPRAVRPCPVCGERGRVVSAGTQARIGHLDLDGWVVHTDSEGVAYYHPDD